MGPWKTGGKLGITSIMCSCCECAGVRISLPPLAMYLIACFADDVSLQQGVAYFSLFFSSLTEHAMLRGFFFRASNFCMR
jgi:hypothetical protein